MLVSSGRTKLTDEALAEAFQWLNSQDVKGAVNSTLRSLNKICVALEKADFAAMKPDVASKVAMNLTKSVDELTRLMALVQGNPDSRTEVVGLGDLIKLLTNEQFEQVSQWIEQGTSKFDA